MKRVLLLLVSLLFFVHQASAQFTAGLTGGLSFAEPKFAQIDVSSPATFNFGVTCNVDLPLGFSIQPAITFIEKSAYFKETLNVSMSYIEIPVSFQWGPDLLVFRPFVDVTPFAGCLLRNSVDTVIDGVQYASAKRMEGRQMLEYGLGVGGGIDIWKLRLVARYNWNMGSAFTDEKSTDLGVVKVNDHFKGLTLSLSVFPF